MNNAITLLSGMEKQCLALDELLNNNVFFSSYIKSREKTVLRKIVRSSRRKVYHISDSQVPLKVYTDQSETVLLILSAKKKSISWLFQESRYCKISFCQVRMEKYS